MCSIISKKTRILIKGKITGTRTTIRNLCIRNLSGLRFVPIIGLDCIGVVDLYFVHPIHWLAVRRIIYFLLSSCASVYFMQVRNVHETQPEEQ